MIRDDIIGSVSYRCERNLMHGNKLDILKTKKSKYILLCCSKSYAPTYLHTTNVKISTDVVLLVYLHELNLRWNKRKYVMDYVKKSINLLLLLVVADLRFCRFSNWKRKHWWRHQLRIEYRTAEINIPTIFPTSRYSVCSWWSSEWLKNKIQLIIMPIEQPIYLLFAEKMLILLF